MEEGKGFCAGFFGGPQKKELGREETEAIEVFFVHGLGRLDLDQRLEAKAPFEEGFLT